MSSAYILVVEDDLQITDIVELTLKREGYKVRSTTSGEEALKMVAAEKPDVIVLDIMLPNMDGLTICRKIREVDAYDDICVLFLTAKGKTEDVVAGLDAGGDDYLSKPFEVNELKARVRALYRRDKRHLLPQPTNQASTLRVGNLHLDSDAYQVKTPFKTIQLTATEHRLLRYMMENANNVLPATILLEKVWLYPPETGDPDLVRAHMRKLRTKIETEPNDPLFIHTVHGVGYMVMDKSEKTPAP